MRKTLMLMIAALALTTWSVAQDQNNSADQDKDNAAKQDMKKAGHDVKQAAKATGSGLKKGAVSTKEKVTGRKDDADNDARRLPNRDDDRDADRDRDRDRDADHKTAQRTASGQNPAADTPGERNLPDSINIVGVPSVNPNRSSATIAWQTNKNAASDVWLEGGGIRGHRTGYERGGSRNHSVSFSNLKPNTTYNYIIRSRKGQVRYEGSFTTK